MDMEVGDDEMVCERCGFLNDLRASRCRDCGVPLDDFAGTSPWEMGTLNHRGSQDAADPKLKPIVFWGVMAWFGLSGLAGALSLVLAFQGGYAHPLLSFVVLGYVILCGWAVKSVGKRYFAKE